LGYTSVIFLDLGVKVVGTYYCDLLLSHQLLPAIINDLFIANFLLSVTVKEFLKMIKLLLKYIPE